jgi:beta-D-xylosidase 4
MVSTPFEAIVDKVGADRASFAPGAWPSGEGTWAFGDAIAAAAAADVVLITIGSDSKGTLNGFTYYTTVEKESMDRKSLELPGMQLDLVKAIASQTKTPIICILVHGGPLDISELIAMPRVEAVLSIGYPGQRGGVALANVLWGITPPSGRLTMTWPFANYTTQVSEASMAMRVWPGRTHRFIQVPVLFKFGFGLQYTEFEHSLFASPVYTAGAPPGRWIAECNVTNVGDTASAHVALLFGVPPANTGQSGGMSASLPASLPRQVLLGFERLGMIEPNTTVHHTFDLVPRHWQLSDRSGAQQHTPGCWNLVLERASAELCV